VDADFHYSAIVADLGAAICQAALVVVGVIVAVDLDGDGVVEVFGRRRRSAHR
jgi:hypothetical protein